MTTLNYVVILAQAFILFKSWSADRYTIWDSIALELDRLWTARRAVDSAKFAKQNYTAHSLRSLLGSGASQQTLLIDPRLPWELKAKSSWVDSTP